MDRLNIRNEMAAYDRKQRDYYDCMTEEEQKKFSPYLMIRWGSTVQGSRELQEFYVIAANQLVNRHYLTAQLFGNSGGAISYFYAGNHC